MNKKVVIVVEMECIFDPARKEGNAITFMPSEAGEITEGEGESKRKIGKWYAPLFGGVEIHVDSTNETWVLHSLDVIRAFFQEVEKQNEP